MKVRCESCVVDNAPNMAQEPEDMTKKYGAKPNDFVPFLRADLGAGCLVSLRFLSFRF